MDPPVSEPNVMGHSYADTAAAEPPGIRWVGLLDVHHDELDTVAILLVQLGETPGPTAEGGSGVAPEDECDRSLALEVRQADDHPHTSITTAREISHQLTTLRPTNQMSAGCVRSGRCPEIHGFE